METAILLVLLAVLAALAIVIIVTGGLQLWRRSGRERQDRA